MAAARRTSGVMRWTHLRACAAMDHGVTVTGRARTAQAFVVRRTISRSSLLQTVRPVSGGAWTTMPNVGVWFSGR